MKDIIIRQANRDDAQTIHELHTESVTELCKGYYSDDLIHGWIGNRTPANYFSVIDQNKLFVAIKDSEIVGFGSAVPGEVERLYVSPYHVNSGIGSLLLGQAMMIALVNSCKVIVVSTLNAEGFYSKRGFISVEKITTRHGSVDLPCILMEYKPDSKL